MLISVHLPKTAGSSFASSLNDLYGSKILKDYADIPLHTKKPKRYTHAVTQSLTTPFRSYQNIECIHGHFMPLKYRFHTLRRETKFITWMRDPIERLASQYYYFKRPTKHMHPLQKKMLAEKWSLERFCLSPEFRNVYSQFLWGFPLENFDFIGIVENYDKEIEYFSQHFMKHKNTLQSYQINANPDSQRVSYFSEAANLKKKVEAYHAKDILLYKKAIAIRKEERYAAQSRTCQTLF